MKNVNKIPIENGIIKAFLNLLGGIYGLKNTDFYNFSSSTLLLAYIKSYVSQNGLYLECIFWFNLKPL